MSLLGGTPPELLSILEPLKQSCRSEVRLRAVSIEPRFIKSFLDDRDTTKERVLDGYSHIKVVLPDPEDSSRRLIVVPESFDLAAAGSKYGELKECTVTTEVGFDNMSTQQILARIMPAGVSTPSAFETIGHIAHLNLRDEQLPYKYQVGAVILAKNRAIRTVVNKVGIIENEFRVLPMELLAGVPETVCSVQEHGCVFHLDFAKVYWNSRLSHEHGVVVDRAFELGAAPARTVLSTSGLAGEPRCSPDVPSLVIADIFAGVGPFSVPASMRGAVVYANDLNPESVSWLKKNVSANLEDESLVSVSNLDGREFVRSLKEKGICVDHFFMNLPSLAPEFCDAFRGACTHYGPGDLPVVHCHGFAPTEPEKGTPEQTLEERCRKAMRCSEEEWRQCHIQTRNIRLVGPKKLMFCVEFRIPDSVGRLQ